MERPRIVYMGTPEFAVSPLKAVIEAGYPIEAVVTVPDKPAGRGQKLTQSAVKIFALEKGLRILQPINLKDPAFIAELKAIQPDLIIVVAFRILPREVFSMPALGTFNLHASLLPAYRGAAPIQRAIMNGETQTGLSTFLLDEGIDTGKIIYQKHLTIGEQETAGELHDRMMMESPEIVLATIHFLISGEESSNATLILVNAPQPADATIFPPAPKILKNDCHIHWNEACRHIFNQIRGLSPYPGAYTELKSSAKETFHLKIFKAKIPTSDEFQRGKAFDVLSDPGSVITDGRSYMYVRTLDGFIQVLEVQLQGKKRLNTEEFLRGFRMEGQWIAL